MDEVSIISREQRRVYGASGVLAATRLERIERNLGNPRRPSLIKAGEDSSYKETKWKEAGRVADETVVLMMDSQHKLSGGKGLY